jgi:HEAT repeat protein
VNWVKVLGEALPALVVDPTWEQRRSNSEAVRRLGTKAKFAIPALTAALNDKCFSVYYKSAAILCAIGEDGVPALVQDMKRGSPRCWVTIRAVASIGPPAKPAIPILTALTRKEATVRREAAHAIIAIDPKDPAALRAAIPVLDLELKDESAEWRERAAASLSRLGRDGKPAVRVLVGLMREPRYAFQATVSLWRLGPVAKSAQSTLEKLAANKRYDEPLRVLAAGALLRVDPATNIAKEVLLELLPMAIGMLREGEDEVSVLVAQSIGQLGGRAKSALPVLRKLTTTPNQELRQAAMRAIRQIQDGRE